MDRDGGKLSRDAGWASTAFWQRDAVPESLARRSADGHVRQADLTIRASQGACRVSPAMAALKHLAKDLGAVPQCAFRLCSPDDDGRRGADAAHQVVIIGLG